MKKKLPIHVAGLFFGLAGMVFLLIYLTDQYILTVNFYDKSDQPVSGIPEQAAGLYEVIKRWVYLFAGIFLMARIFLTALIINTALYFRRVIVPFKKLLCCVIIADYIFLLPAALKIILFKFYFPNGNLSNWHHYFPLSLLSLFPQSPAFLIYPLQVLNIFEVIYWFLLAYGVGLISRKGFDWALSGIMVSYVPALTIWVTLVTFLTLLFFPQAG